MNRTNIGPREALEQIAAMIKVGMAADDLATVHDLLRDMQSVARRAIGTGTLRHARLLTAFQPQPRSDA